MASSASSAIITAISHAIAGEWWVPSVRIRWNSMSQIPSDGVCMDYGQSGQYGDGAMVHVWRSRWYSDVMGVGWVENGGVGGRVETRNDSGNQGASRVGYGTN